MLATQVRNANCIAKHNLRDFKFYYVKKGRLKLITNTNIERRRNLSTIQQMHTFFQVR